MARESCAALGLVHGLGEERNAAGRLAARGREPAVHAPEMGEVRRIQPLACLGGAAQRLGRLPDVVLQQPGLGQRAPQLDQVRARQSGPFEQPDEHGRRLRSLPSIQGGEGLRVGSDGGTPGV